MSDFSPLREAVDTLASRAPSPEFGELKRRAAHRGRRHVALWGRHPVAVIAGTVLASTVLSDRRAVPAGPPAATIEQPNPIPTPTPSATPTPTPTMEANLTLRGDGIGPFSFGAKQVDVAAVLHDRLGYPVKRTTRASFARWKAAPGAVRELRRAGGLLHGQRPVRVVSALSGCLELPPDKKLPAALTMQATCR